MDRHTVDDSLLNPKHGNVADERQATSRRHRKGTDVAGIAEAGIEVLAIHRQADAVGSPGVRLGPCCITREGQGIYIDPGDVAGCRIRGIYAGLATAIEHTDAVHSKKSPADTHAAGLNILYQHRKTVCLNMVKTDTGGKRSRRVIIRDKILSCSWQLRTACQNTKQQYASTHYHGSHEHPHFLLRSANS